MEPKRFMTMKERILILCTMSALFLFACGLLFAVL